MSSASLSRRPLGGRTRPSRSSTLAEDSASIGNLNESSESNTNATQDPGEGAPNPDEQTGPIASTQNPAGEIGRQEHSIRRARRNPTSGVSYLERRALRQQSLMSDVGSDPNERAPPISPGTPNYDGSQEALYRPGRKDSALSPSGTPQTPSNSYPPFTWTESPLTSPHVFAPSRNPFSEQFSTLVSPTQGSSSTLIGGQQSQGGPTLGLPSANPQKPSPSTPSAAYWAQIRNVFGPTAPAALSTAPPPDSLGSSTNLSQHFRDQTAASKSSRLGRLGFKAVVEQVSKEAALHASTRFEDDLRQTCWTTKYGGVAFGSRAPGDGRSEREGSLGTLGATSTTSLPLPPSTAPFTAAGTSFSIFTNTASSRAGGMRRPSSVHGNDQSLRPLQQVMLQHAPLTASNPGMTFPQEPEIMPLILAPFLSGDGSKRMEEERGIALEIFELIIKTWRSQSEEIESERRMWCCKAVANGANSSSLRTRILITLGNILFEPSPAFPISSPLALQAVVQTIVSHYGAFVALTATHPSIVNDPAVGLFRDLLSRLFRGESGKLAMKDVSDEYRAPYSAADEGREPELRRIVLTEGVLRAMRLGPEDARRSILNYIVEGYWPVDQFPDGRDPSTLELRIHLRKLLTFAKAALRLLRPDSNPDPPLPGDDAPAIFHFIKTRVLPDLTKLSNVDTPDIAETRATVAQVLLELLNASAQADKESAAAIIGSWWGEPSNQPKWRKTLESEIQQMVKSGDWDSTVRTLHSFVTHIEQGVRAPIVASFLPFFFDRLVSDPPATSIPLTSLLSSLSQSYPQAFYKPLFLCAAATKEPRVIPPLRILLAVSQHLPNYWTTDAEMVAVALMSDPGSANKGKSKEGAPADWAGARLGQCIVTLEIIAQIRKLISNKKDPLAPPDSSQSTVVRFVTSLETRLAILMEARELEKLFPFSQRLLLTCLLLEMRSYTRSLKPAPWLPKIITWALHAHTSAPVPGPEKAASVNGATIQRDAVEELTTTLTRISSVYIESFDKSQNYYKQRQSLVRNSAIFDSSTLESLPNTDRQMLLASLPPRLITATLRLLVSICGLLGAEEHLRLGPLLWSMYLSDIDEPVAGPTCFLLMQCAEKAPEALLPVIVSELESSAPSIRLQAIQRISILFSWRFQILTQSYITDRARRRPFRLARKAISFVPTDVGSTHYVAPEVQDEARLQIGSSLPPELRRRVLELGWGADEKEEEEKKRQWDRAPLALFPNTELEHLNPEANRNTAEMPNGDDSQSGGVKGLLRRKSSASGYLAGAKRKSIFVPPLLVVFPVVARLMLDVDRDVAGAARELVMVIMKDEPALLARPVMEEFSVGVKEEDESTSTIRAFLSGHPALPPALSHHLFNHIAGLLKSVTRQSSVLQSGIVFAHALPLLADLVPQVSGLSVRELRRHKIEALLLPSFLPIPRPLAAAASSLSDALLHVCMARVARNMLLYHMLQRNPKDINTLRKTFSQLSLPAVDLEWEVRPLELGDFVPRRTNRLSSEEEDNLLRVSAPLAKSYLLLITQVFCSLNRHLNDRLELAKFMSGASRIVLARGNDIGVIGHALIVFMTASTRFRRLFASNAGFSLFMPAVLRIYCEMEGTAPIRSAIEYAVQRFYACHKETFVFQTLEVASHVIHHPTMASTPEDQQWYAANVFSLIATLGPASSPNRPDASGIYGMNMVQERETLITMVNEKPELLFPSISRTGSQTKDSDVMESLSSLAADKDNNVSFPLDDFVRLFLTVIPHNPFILRAQYLLTLFRLMVPSFYHASNTARMVLRDGVQAFGPAVFERLETRSWLPEAVQQRASDAEVFVVEGKGADDLFTAKPTSPSDPAVMRREYLQSVSAFAKVGGRFERMAVHDILILVRDALRDTTPMMANHISEFVCEFAEYSLSIDTRPPPKATLTLLKELVPLFRIHAASLDFSRVITAVTGLVADPAFAADRDFVRMVVWDFCSPALQICHVAGTERVLMDLPLRMAVISLIANAVSLPGISISTSLSADAVAGPGGMDVLSMVESQVPTATFLAGVVLPLSLRMKTAMEAAAGDAQWQVRESWKLDSFRRAWVRLLAYAMAACEGPALEQGKLKSSESATSEGAVGEKDPDKGKGRGMDQAMRFFIAVQIVKIVVIRGERDISAVMPGVWTRIAAWMKRVLGRGNAEFALASLSVPHPPLNQTTPPASPHQHPSMSPTTSPHRLTLGRGSADLQVPSRFAPTSPVQSRTTGNSKASATPRLVDYLLWSTLELVCLFRSPLAIQLRLWIQEKMFTLDKRVRAITITSGGAEGQIGVRASPLLGPSRQSRRVSTLMFAKPRMKNQGRTSGGPSPDGSPRLGVGQLSRSPSLLSLGPARDNNQPVSMYNRFPDASPTLGNEDAPRIVHLGPTRLARTLSTETSKPGTRDNLNDTLQSVLITSPSLVYASHRRLRAVQSSMGYDPMAMPEAVPNEVDEYDDLDGAPWTRGQALKLVVEETTRLMEEYRDCFYVTEESE